MVTYHKGKYFQGSLTAERADTLLELQKYTVLPTLKHIIVDLPEKTINLINETVKNHIKKTKDFTTITLEDMGLSRSKMPIGELRDMQTVGVAFQYYAESCIIGDEVGLGKTVQVAGYTNLMRKDFAIKGRKFRYLFLTEKSSAPQVHAKMIQFTGDYVHFLPSATQSLLDKELNYKGVEQQSMVGTHALLQNADFITFCIKNPFDLIIIDESRILKERNSTYYQNTAQLVKVIPRVVLLNATPLETSLHELYNQLRILDTGYLPNVTEFESTYVRKRFTSLGNKILGYKNEEEFKVAIGLRYIARTRESEGATFLENNTVKVIIETSKEQRTLLRKSSLKAMAMDFPTSVDKTIEFNEETAPKLGALILLLKQEVRAKNKSVLIYCRYKDSQIALQQKLEHEGFYSEIVNGEQKQVKDRQTKIDRFNNGEYKILITNIVRGIDMDIAEAAIIYSVFPNPQELNQFVGRMTRKFNVNNKTVYMLVYEGYEMEVVNDKLNFRLDATKSFTPTGRNILYDTVSSEKPYIYAHGQIYEMF